MTAFTIGLVRKLRNPFGDNVEVYELRGIGNAHPVNILFAPGAEL